MMQLVFNYTLTLSIRKLKLVHNGIFKQIQEIGNDLDGSAKVELMPEDTDWSTLINDNPNIFKGEDK